MLRSVIWTDDVNVTVRGRALISSLSLEVKRSTINLLTGPTGSGKSTVIRLLLGDIRPDSGRILVGGRSLDTLSKWGRSRHRQRLGHLPDVMDRRSGEPLHKLLRRANIDLQPPEIRARFRDLAMQRGIHFDMRAPAASVSDGQRQTLLILGFIACRKQLLLLDEPSRNQSPSDFKSTQLMLEQLVREGSTLVIATGDRTTVGLPVHQVINLERGRRVHDELLQLRQQTKRADSFRPTGRAPQGRGR